MTSPTSAAAGKSAARLRKYLVWTYIIGSAAAVAVTFFLVGLGLEFSLRHPTFYFPSSLPSPLRGAFDTLRRAKARLRGEGGFG
jgi:hypothetical protein